MLSGTISMHILILKIKYYTGYHLHCRGYNMYGIPYNILIYNRAKHPDSKFISIFFSPCRFHQIIFSIIDIFR